MAARIDRILNATRTREDAKVTGGVLIVAPGKRRAKGSSRTTKGILIGTGGPCGGISVNPAVTFSHYVRRLLRGPRPIAPVTIYNPDGTVREVVAGEEFIRRRWGQRA